MTSETDFFPWMPEFETNVSEIDQQHRYLVGLVNDFQRAVKGGGPRESLSDVFTFLVGYVEVHFAAEERIMAASSHPERTTHEMEHAALRSEVCTLSERCRSGEEIPDEKVAVFLRDWLTRHIQGADRRLALHLASLRNPSPG